MATPGVQSQVRSLEADKLLVLCEEVTRATAESVHRFIEPAPGVLLRATSKQHNIIFGRRGSGKSTLLRKAAADLTIDRRPIAFVDMETFKGHSYPDVLISVLIKSLQEFEGWLEGAATTPATKKSFWAKLFGTTPLRPAFNKNKTKDSIVELKSLISDLEKQLLAPEVSERNIKRVKSDEQSDTLEVNGGIKTEIINFGSKLGSLEKTGNSTEIIDKYTSHKIEYLHQNILRFQKFFRDLSSLSDGPSFLILDDLYYIRRADQSKVIDYFHRLAKNNGLWLKIGIIKHRSEWYKHSDPPVGMKLGDDAKEINLDISLEKFETLRAFLRTILTSLMADTPPLSISNMMNSTALDRLIIASGGVTRDFIGIFSNSILQARNRSDTSSRGPKVGAEDVNLATGDYAPQKQEEFKVDSDTDREFLESSFQNLAKFCTEKSKCNVFLISQKLSGPVRIAIDQLIDLRMIHPVKSRVTLKTGPQGAIFEAFMLDLSQYSAARRIHNFQIVDLNGANKDETIRKASYIYSG